MPRQWRWHFGPKSDSMMPLSSPTSLSFAYTCNHRDNLFLNGAKIKLNAFVWDLFLSHATSTQFPYLLRSFTLYCECSDGYVSLCKWLPESVKRAMTALLCCETRRPTSVNECSADAHIRVVKRSSNSSWCDEYQRYWKWFLADKWL
jgi:hypothetical protein